MLLDEVIGKDVLHVTGIEQCIVDIVDFAIDLCIGNCLGNILDADHLAGTSGYEVGNGSRSRVQVVNEFVTRQFGKVAGYTVEVISLVGIGLIETLGAYLELEVFHGFINEVLSLEQRQLQIVERIVTFLVVYIEYGCKLRELVCNMIEQQEGFLLVALLVVMELQNKHPFAGIGVAENHVAQQSYLITYIIIGITMGKREIAYLIAYLIVQVIHQVTLGDGINLIKSASNMKSNCRFAQVAWAIFGPWRQCSYLLFGVPTLVSAAKFKFIAIFACFF